MRESTAGAGVSPQLTFAIRPAVHERVQQPHDRDVLTHSIGLLAHEIKDRNLICGSFSVMGRRLLHFESQRSVAVFHVGTTPNRGEVAPAQFLLDKIALVIRLADLRASNTFCKRTVDRGPSDPSTKLTSLNDSLAAVQHDRDTWIQAHLDGMITSLFIPFPAFEIVVLDVAVVRCEIGVGLWGFHGRSLALCNLSGLSTSLLCGSTGCNSARHYSRGFQR